MAATSNRPRRSPTGVPFASILAGQNRYGPRSLSATPNGPSTNLAIHRPGDAARRLWPIQDPARRAFRPVPPWDSAGSAPRHEVLRSVNILCRLRHDATMARWLARCGPATVCVPTPYAMRCLLAARPVIRAPVLTAVHSVTDSSRLVACMLIRPSGMFDLIARPHIRERIAAFHLAPFSFLVSLGVESVTKFATSVSFPCFQYFLTIVICLLFGYHSCSFFSVLFSLRS